jgi:hypothetical protein
MAAGQKKKNYRNRVKPLAAILLLSLFCRPSVANEDAADTSTIALMADIGGHRIYYSTRNLCGVTSAYIVLKSLGMEKDFESILKEMKPGIYGCTMAQLYELLKREGLSVVGVKTTALALYKTLRSSPSKHAIVNMLDHWVVALKARDNDFLMIDFPRKYYMSVSALDRVWDGNALIISRSMTLGNWIRTYPIIVAVPIAAVALVFLGLRVRHSRRLRR